MSYEQLYTGTPKGSPGSRISHLLGLSAISIPIHQIIVVDAHKWSHPFR